MTAITSDPATATMAGRPGSRQKKTMASAQLSREGEEQNPMNGCKRYAEERIGPGRAGRRGSTLGVRAIP